jgi:hypothetical protein
MERKGGVTLLALPQYTREIFLVSEYGNAVRRNLQIHVGSVPFFLDRGIKGGDQITRIAGTHHSLIE